MRTSCFLVLALCLSAPAYAQTSVSVKETRRTDASLTLTIQGIDSVVSAGVAINGSAWELFKGRKLQSVLELELDLVACHLCKSGANDIEVNLFTQDGKHTDFRYRFEIAQQLLSTSPVRVVADPGIRVSAADVSRFSRWAQTQSVRGLIHTLYFVHWDGDTWGTGHGGVIKINDRLLARTGAEQQVVFFHEAGHLACQRASDKRIREAFYALESTGNEIRIIDVVSCEKYLPAGQGVLGHGHVLHSEVCADALCVRNLFPTEMAARRAKLPESEAALLDKFLSTLP